MDNDNDDIDDAVNNDAEIMIMILMTIFMAKMMKTMTTVINSMTYSNYSELGLLQQILSSISKQVCLKL